ncbi:MAG TPA: tRNA (adenosine(37)-N6)-threonylcarbamoyltransferase complex dimerization subunit type 1 TsaB [Gemmatimonadaceae bacterium]|nr:tRNA (adenosine(37)-N6)-threonylcarbamoyltransferase complex dimerization subunit type 1 TsaB [Gemmatimonadaceae bacterium]
MSDHTLAIEGATYAGSVALLKGSTVIAERSLPDSAIPGKGGRKEALLPALAECLAEGGVEPRALTRVVCGSGPGGFTSLRVAASIAKGIANGAGIPLYAVSSLMLTVASLEDFSVARSYLSVLPAMRGELYALLVEIDEAGNIRSAGDHALIPESDAQREADISGATLLGAGSQSAERPHARGAARILESIIEGGPVDLAAWEPIYGRLAEAQVRWESQHGRSLTAKG